MARKAVCISARLIKVHDSKVSSVEVVAKNEEEVVEEGEEESESVSYTHLDVYKRQVVTNINNMCTLIFI